MAAPSNAENRRINAQTRFPSRSAAVASTTGNVPSVTEMLDFNAEFTFGPVQHSRTDYVLAAVPDTANDWNEVIPNPHVGDRAFVFLTDDVGTVGVKSYREYHYTLNTSNALAWRQVAYV